MENNDNEGKSKILIIGATGYLGDFMVKACLSLGHPTFAYIRPIHTSSHISKLLHLQSLGLTFFQVLTNLLFHISHN